MRFIINHISILYSIFIFVNYRTSGILADCNMALNMLLGAIYKLLSGAWIPVTMFPDLLYKINFILPFRAIYAIPVTIMTSQMNIQNIWKDIRTQFIWIIFLFVITEIIWKIGKRKLIVQGG